jgi:hypothetical protein
MSSLTNIGSSVFSHLDLKQFFLAPAKGKQLHRETGMRDGDSRLYMASQLRRSDNLVPRQDFVLVNAVQEQS